jgi:hypothetical protein
LLAAHGADPLFMHHAKWVAERGFGQAEQTDNATVLMAAVGFGGGNAKPWVDAPRAEKEALTLAAVKLAVELGADVNATGDGRTALDGANNLKYKSVIDFLASKGAKAGTGAGGRGGRGGRGARGGRAADPTAEPPDDEPK